MKNQQQKTCITLDYTSIFFYKIGNILNFISLNLKKIHIKVHGLESQKRNIYMCLKT